MGQFPNGQESVDGVDQDPAHRILTHAVGLSKNAQNVLRNSRNERLEAEKYRRQAEVEAAKATSEALSAVRESSRQLIQEAGILKAEADAARTQARTELEGAKAIKSDAEENARRMEAEARERSDTLLHQALQEAEQQVTEMRGRAAQEVQKIIEDINTLREAVQEELRTQVNLSEAARIKVQNVMGESLNFPDSSDSAQLVSLANEAGSEALIKSNGSMKPAPNRSKRNGKARTASPK